MLFGCTSTFNNDELLSEAPHYNNLNQRLEIPNKNVIVYTNSENTAPLEHLSVSYNESTYTVSATVESNNLNQPISHSINFNNSNWKFQANENVLELATSIINTSNMTLNDINTVLIDLENIFTSSLSSSSNEILYGLSAMISSFSIAKRTKINPLDAGCTIHPGFLVGKSFFGCQEDHTISRTELTNALDDYEIEFGNSSFIQSIRDMLSFNSSVNISFKDIYTASNSGTNFQNSTAPPINPSSGNCGTCWLGCGSDHGCCGNYKGCCYYVHGLCYLHDKMCKNCKPKWFCGPQCKKDDVTSIDELIPDPYDLISNDVDDDIPTTPVEYSFPETNSVYYYVINKDDAHDWNYNLEYSTSVVRRADKKYYRSSIFSEDCLLPDGYYFNNSDNFYYKVLNGIIIEIGNKTQYCNTCPRPYMHEISPNPFIPCTIVDI